MAHAFRVLLTEGCGHPGDSLPDFGVASQAAD